MVNYFGEGEFLEEDMLLIGIDYDGFFFLNEYDGDIWNDFLV